MTRKQLFKILKQEKQFSRFCLVVANCFYESEEPQIMKEKYLTLLLKGKGINKTIITQIVKNWKDSPYIIDKTKIRIQQ